MNPKGEPGGVGSLYRGTLPGDFLPPVEKAVGARCPSNRSRCSEGWSINVADRNVLNHPLPSCKTAQLGTRTGSVEEAKFGILSGNFNLLGLNRLPDRGAFRVGHNF